MAQTPGIAPALAALASILEREKRRGLETVPLSPGNLSLLRSLPSHFRQSKPAQEAPAPAGSTNARAAAAFPERVTPVPTRGAPATVAREIPAPVQTSIPAAAEAGRDETRRREQLNAIFKAVKQAPEPRALGTLFETVVFAAGNPMAEIVFVGEAPGAEEEKQKKPFVGPAGQKLDQILKAMGLRREDVYISNIVKFRPKKGDGRFQGSSNRPPTQEEMASCLPFIRAEIEVLRPRVIVALGRTAAEGLLERGGAIASFRNGEHDFGMPVIVTYHPSYLLRQEAASAEEGKRAKRQVWEDMLRVMERAGLPVSEKQRGYFL